MYVEVWYELSIGHGIIFLKSISLLSVLVIHMVWLPIINKETATTKQMVIPHNMTFIVEKNWR